MQYFWQIPLVMVIDTTAILILSLMVILKGA